MDTSSRKETRCNWLCIQWNSNRVVGHQPRPRNIGTRIQSQPSKQFWRNTNRDTGDSSLDFKNGGRKSIMSRHDRELAERLKAGLQAFGKVKILPGISTAEYRTAFIEQLIESVHRVEFVRVMRDRDISGR